MAYERVESVTAYIGSGPPRFYLPVDPEYPYQSYGVVRTIFMQTSGAIDMHNAIRRGQGEQQPKNGTECDADVFVMGSEDRSMNLGFLDPHEV